METQTLIAYRRTLIPILCFFFAFLFIALIASDSFAMNELLGLESIYFPYINFFRPFQIGLPFIDGIIIGDFGIFFPTDHLILVPLFIGTGLWYLFKESGLRLIAFLASCVLSLKLLTTTAHLLQFLFDRSGSDGKFVMVSIISLAVVGGAAFLVLLILKKSSSTRATKVPSLWIRFVGYTIDLILIVNIALALRIDSRGIIGRLLLLFLFVVFYFFFERIFYFTPGKILFGLRVQKADGTDPDEQSIFKRTFARLIPLEQLSFFGKNGGFHDTLSKTIVRKIDE